MTHIQRCDTLTALMCPLMHNSAKYHIALSWGGESKMSKINVHFKIMKFKWHYRKVEAFKKKPPREGVVV